MLDFDDAAIFALLRRSTGVSRVSALRRDAYAAYRHFSRH